MEPLRLGVIGVGRGWTRWQQTLLASDEVAVLAVHDPAPRRAKAASEPFRAVACAGVVELLERDDLDAVLLGRAWFGTWPLTQAASRNKPVLCTVPAIEDAPGAVWLAAWPGLWRGARVLRAVVADLGPVRSIQAVSACGPEFMLTLAFDFYGVEPLAVRSAHLDGLATWLFDFGSGKTAQLTHRSQARGTIAIEAANGWAQLELPGRLEWTDNTVRHTLQLTRRAEIDVLRAFVKAVRNGETMTETPRLLRAAAFLNGVTEVKDRGVDTPRSPSL